MADAPKAQHSKEPGETENDRGLVHVESALSASEVS